MLQSLTEVYEALSGLEKAFVWVLLGLVVAWFYGYYARAAKHRAQLARLRQTIENLNARERQHEARYEQLLQRFQSLELNVNQMHQRIDFALPENDPYTHRRREAGRPVIQQNAPRDPSTP